MVRCHRCRDTDAATRDFGSPEERAGLLTVAKWDRDDD